MARSVGNDVRGASNLIKRMKSQTYDGCGGIRHRGDKSTTTAPGAGYQERSRQRCCYHPVAERAGKQACGRPSQDFNKKVKHRWSRSIQEPTSPECAPAHLSDVVLVEHRGHHQVTPVGGADPEALVHPAVGPSTRLRAGQTARVRGQGRTNGIFGWMGGGGVLTMTKSRPTDHRSRTSAAGEKKRFRLPRHGDHRGRSERQFKSDAKHRRHLP